MAVNAKLGVDLSSFEAGIRSGQAILKGLNAEMKATEAEFKATGNSEQKLANQTKTLNSTLQVQKGIVDNAKNALKAMDDAGVKPTDASYQKLYATMMNATAGMNEAQAQLNALGSSAQDAASGADQLTTSVNKIGKKISLDQVISGINSITKGLESAAKKALELGDTLWNNIMDSARLSDDILTQANILDMTPEQYQQYKGVFDTIADITVKDWMNAKRKIETAMTSPTNEQGVALKALGFGKYVDRYGVVRTREIADNWEDGLWAIAEELQRKVDSGEITMEMADVYGNALFGKNFSALKPLFGLGKEAFAAALKEQATISDDALKKNTALNDKVIELEASLQALQAELVSAVAPALTTAAEALDGLLKSILEYLQTPEGQQMLEDMGKAVEGLFSDLSKIDPQEVVEGFTGVFNSIIDGFKWLEQNSGAVIGALETIVVGWGLLKLTGGALEIVKLIEGISGVAATGAATAAGKAGAAAGKSWASAFASAAIKAAPFLAFLWTLIDPDSAKTNDTVGNSELLDAEGKLTKEAQEYGYTLNDKGELVLKEDKTPEKYTKEQEATTIDLRSDTWESKTNWRNRFTDSLNGKQSAPEDVLDQRPSYMRDQHPQVQVEPVAPEGAAENLSEQIGTVPVAAQLVLSGPQGTSEYGGSGGGGVNVLMSKANGIHYVPYDGMLASLHKGERIMPAREVQSRSYNSNLYVESMYMNNGTDAAGLAAAMAAAQRRTMSGFGS